MICPLYWYLPTPSVQKSKTTSHDGNLLSEIDTILGLSHLPCCRYTPLEKLKRRVVYLLKYFTHLTSINKILEVHFAKSLSR